MQIYTSTASNGQNLRAVVSRKTSRIHTTEAVVAKLPVKENAASLAVIHSKLSLPASLKDIPIAVSRMTLNSSILAPLLSLIFLSSNLESAMTRWKNISSRQSDYTCLLAGKNWQPAYSSGPYSQ
jgi:hypothetical protein